MAYPVVTVTRPAGLVNGRLTPCQLGAVYMPGHGNLSLGPTMIRTWNAFATTCHTETGATLTCTSLGDGYRSYQSQLDLFLTRYSPNYNPAMNVLTEPRTGPDGGRWYLRRSTPFGKPYAPCASPGASNHGLGIAIDTCLWVNGANAGITSRPAVWTWICANAVPFGLSWEMQSEPWHLRAYLGDSVAPRVTEFETALGITP